MAFTPISNTVPQYEENGVAASGYFIKFYESGTTTPTAMATDSTGTTLLDKCELNTEGYPINGSGAVFIPHINVEYKIALFRNAADADANDLASAAWDVDGLFPYFTDSSIGTAFNQVPLNADIVYPIANVSALRALTGISVGQKFQLDGHTNQGIGGGTLTATKLHTGEIDDNGYLFVVDGVVIEREKNGQITPEDFGATGGSTIDSLSFINSAISVATSISGDNNNAIVSGNSNGFSFGFNGTISVPFNVIFQDFEIFPLSSTSGLTVQKGGCAKNINCNAQGKSYSGVMYDVVSGASGHNGSQSKLPVLDNCRGRVDFGDTGECFRWFAGLAGEFVQYTRSYNLVAENFINGLHFHADRATGDAFVNGNLVFGYVGFNCVDAIKMEGSNGGIVEGNIVTGVGLEFQEGGGNSDVRMVNASYNVVKGFSFDGSGVICDENSDGNDFDINTSNKLGNDFVTDLGKFNRFRYASGGEINDSISSKLGNDEREGKGTRGTAISQMNPENFTLSQWNAIDDSKISFGASIEGRAGNKAVIPRLTLTADTAVGQFVTQSVAPTFCLNTNPVTHMTLSFSATSDSNVAWAGFGDSTNGVFFVRDAGSYGTSTLRMVTYSGGISTAVDTGVGTGPTTLIYIALRCTETSVKAFVGRYFTDSVDEQGDIQAGINACYNTGTTAHVGAFEITTNLPADLVLPMQIRSEIPSGTSIINIHHFKCMSGRGLA